MSPADRPDRWNARPPLSLLATTKKYPAQEARPTTRESIACRSRLEHSERARKRRRCNTTPFRPRLLPQLLLTTARPNLESFFHPLRAYPVVCSLRIPPHTKPRQDIPTALVSFPVLLRHDQPSNPPTTK